MVVLLIRTIVSLGFIMRSNILKCTVEETEAGGRLITGQEELNFQSRTIGSRRREVANLGR